MSKTEPLLLMHGIGGHLEADAKSVLALSTTITLSRSFLSAAACRTSRSTLTTCPLPTRDNLANSWMQWASCALTSRTNRWVAGTFAVMCPFRVKRLILNTIGGIPIAGEKGRRDLQHFEELSRPNVGQAPTIETVRRRTRWLMHESQLALAGRRTRRLAAGNLPAARLPTGHAESARASQVGRFWRECAGDDRTRQLACDTLILWTRFNPIHDLEAATAACAQVLGEQLHVMRADAAHWPQHEAPDEFNTVVHQFLQTGKV